MCVCVWFGVSTLFFVLIWAMFQENLNIIIIVMFPVKCFDVLIPGNSPPYHEPTSCHLL